VRYEKAGHFLAEEEPSELIRELEKILLTP